MTPYDAARVRARIAELKQDRGAFVKAMADLARSSPADIEIQDRAAQEATRNRDYAVAAEIYDRLLAVAQPVALLNQAAYVAAYQGDRMKAERLANTAKQAAPNDPQYADTRGEIAYYFGDFKTALQNFEEGAALNAAFLGGLEYWKAADAARMSGDRARAEARSHGGRGDEREAGRDHLVPRSDTDLLERDEERLGARRDADRVLDAEVGGGLLLEEGRGLAEDVLSRREDGEDGLLRTVYRAQLVR